MGKIIRNGIEYSGTSDSANNVNYDNSVSGMNARTVQEGIDELKDGLVMTSVVDNLLSTSTTLPLSANQGRVLDEKISTINESLGDIIIYKDLTITTVSTNIYAVIQGIIPEGYVPIVVVSMEPWASFYLVNRNGNEWSVFAPNKGTSYKVRIFFAKASSV